MPPEPRNTHTLDDVLDAAHRLLSYRPRSESEVRARLLGRFSLALIEEAVSVLKSKGLLDDASFARFWRQSRERHRPRGSFAMRWELLRKGVDREVVEDALEGLDDDKNAYHAACGMLGRLGQADYDTFRKKLFAYLRRRGFGAGTIMGTVEILWRELSHSADSDKESDR